MPQAAKRAVRSPCRRRACCSCFSNPRKVHTQKRTAGGRSLFLPGEEQGLFPPWGRGPRASPAERVAWGEEARRREGALPQAAKRAVRSPCRRRACCSGYSDPRKVHTQKRTAGGRSLFLPVKKAAQNFVPSWAKASRSVFSGRVCVEENTPRPASAGPFPGQQTNDARGRLRNHLSPLRWAIRTPAMFSQEAWTATAPIS